MIAIDGPSGAGKGTVARTIADRLGYRHVDTGAMYRAVAWLAACRDVTLTDGEAVAAVAAQAVFELGDTIVIDGHVVTQEIRTPTIDAAAAIVAQLPPVRVVLVARQREYARDGAVVMEGRDVGTVVLPSADVKVYLDATPGERARRRARDSAHAAGRLAGDVGAVAQALAARDEKDRTRAASPLTLAPDAVYVDTTDLPIDEVVQRVMALVQARLDEHGPASRAATPVEQ